jgi:glycerol dehydrogenase
MDVIKAAGLFGSLTVVAIPTVSSTCASWAPCSIIYNDAGEYVDVYQYDTAPELLIADTEILAKAPVRYIRAGASDALARWYENSVNLRDSNSLHLRWILKQAELIVEAIEGRGVTTIDDLERGKYNADAATEILDANILLTGFFVSPRSTDEPFSGGLAHPLYHLFTVIHDLHKSLHGEQIAFLLVVAAIAAQEPEEQIQARLDIFKRLKQPLTLSDLGLTEDVDAKLDIGVKRVHAATKDGFRKRIRDFTEAELKEAIYEADRRGQAIK